MAKKIMYLTLIGSFLGSEMIFIDIRYFRVSLFKIGIALILVYLVLAFINGAKIVFPKKNKFSVVFMLIWFLYAIISVLWVEDYSSWLKSCWFIGSGMLCFVFYAMYLKTINDIKKSFFVVNIMVVFHQIVGWYEIITRNYIFVRDERVLLYLKSPDYYKIPKPISVFHNQNDYALVMLIGIFIFIVCFFLCNKRSIKLLYGLLIMSSFGLLYATGSRAVMVGFLMGISFFFFMLYKKQKITIKLLSILCFIIVIFLFLPYIVSIIQKILVFNFDKNIMNSESIRINLIMNGLYFLFQTAGFGVGAGNIEYWMAHKAVHSTSGITNMHNWWMEIFAAYGIAVFILYLTFFVHLFVNLYKRYNVSADENEKIISLGFMCIMVGFVIGSISSSSNIGTEWLWVFWAITIAFQGYKGYTVSKIYSVIFSQLNLIKKWETL
ncbi:MAG: O-antigen ligase family protein [Firmicutes bacterium]|nr:O-antigen ligase family protein [Bacillota bacterium]